MCELTLPPLKQKIVSSKPLSGGSVKVSQDDQAVRILISPNEMDPMDTIVELALDGPITGMVEEQNKTRGPIVQLADEIEWWPDAKFGLFIHWAGILDTDGSLMVPPGSLWP